MKQTSKTGTASRKVEANPKVKQAEREVRSILRKVASEGHFRMRYWPIYLLAREIESPLALALTTGSSVQQSAWPMICKKMLWRFPEYGAETRQQLFEWSCSYYAPAYWRKRHLQQARLGKWKLYENAM